MLLSDILNQTSEKQASVDTLPEHVKQEIDAWAQAEANQIKQASTGTAQERADNYVKDLFEGYKQASMVELGQAWETEMVGILNARRA